MPVMSKVEQAFCRSALWNRFAGRLVLPWVLHGVELRGDVLEIGGGSAAMAAQVAERCRGIRLTVTDIDERMVAIARRRLAHLPNAMAMAADVTALPFDDAQFDVVTSYLMLHHVIDWEQAIAEAFRVLRPGGVFLGYDLLDTAAARWTHRLDGSPFRLIKPADLQSTLERAGFEKIHVRVGFAGHVARFSAHNAG